MALVSSPHTAQLLLFGRWVDSGPLWVVLETPERRVARQDGEAAEPVPPSPHKAPRPGMGLTGRAWYPEPLPGPARAVPSRAGLCRAIPSRSASRSGHGAGVGGVGPPRRESGQRPVLWDTLGDTLRAYSKTSIFILCWCRARSPTATDELPQHPPLMY